MVTRKGKPVSLIIPIKEYKRFGDSCKMLRTSRHILRPG